MITNNDKPMCIVLVGLPGSGKSTYANEVLVYDSSGYHHPVVHSSDAIREELYGNINDQEHNDKVFQTLHKRIKMDLLAGKNVVYDATNINKRRRIHFLRSLHGVDFVPVCMVIATTKQECIRRNLLRDNPVPEEVIENMWKNYQPPHTHEGFDSINYLFSDPEGMTVGKFFDDAAIFDQRNSHHAFTLGEHSRRAMEYMLLLHDQSITRGVIPSYLFFATYLHDNGKLYTATETNKRGENDGEVHYYHHENVGAYNSMFYAFHAGFNDDDITEIANLIYFHMRPYTAWRSSTKAYDRDVAICGEDFIYSVLSIHQADIASH